MCFLRTSGPNCQNVNEPSSSINWSFIESLRDLTRLRTQLCPPVRSDIVVVVYVVNVYD